MDYIKLSRKILEWEWYSDINTSRLFIHMLLKANWKEGKFRGTTVPRGSFVSSIGKLAEETQLTNREIRTAISHLKMTGEVTSRAYAKYTVFTVKNYCLYQISDTQSDKQATGKRHSNDTLTTTIEEKKEGKKGRNIPPISPVEQFEKYWSVYPKKKNRALTEKAYVDAVLANVPEEDIVSAAVNYAEYVKIQEIKERYIKNPDRFISDNTFLEYLPGAYKKPTGKAGGNKFNQFQQNDYDFDALEKELLSN